MKLKRVDLTNMKFGNLLVKEMLYGCVRENGRKRTYCKCQCDCGNEYIIGSYEIRHNKYPSCGCTSNHYRVINNRTNEIGNKYNRLEILDIDYSQKPSIAKCKCDCGNIIYVSKADVVSGHTQSCGCLQKERASESSTKDYSGVLFYNGVKVLDKSHTDSNGVWYYNCVCPICGNIFQDIPARIANNHKTSCGCKAQSSNERIIQSILDELNIDYIREKRFDDCKYKYTLPFDFAIYKNNELLCLIEYDGKQHFEPVNYFGGEDEFQLIQIRDSIKNNYCHDNNITLLRFNDKDDINKIKNKIVNIINP